MSRQLSVLPHHRIWPVAILLPTLVSFVLLSGVRGGGFVLCFGADGHVAVEAAEDGRCHGCSDEHEDETPAVSLSGLGSPSTCGSCVDVVLEGHEARGASTPRTGTWVPSADAAHVVSLAWESPPTRPTLAPGATRLTDSPGGPLAHLRTVILRT